MWETKTFKTQAAFDRWVAKNQHRYQIVTIFVANGYGAEYRKLRRIG